MAGENVHPKLRRALFGFRRDDVEGLQARLAQTASDLTRLRGQNDELTAELQSARLALGETAGWFERLPVGLGEFASLAAGDLPGEDAPGRLGAAILDVGGEHLLAQVQLAFGDPTGELEHETSWNENGRPVRTVVRLGGCVVDCTWQPGVNAGRDTAGVIEGLCSAVVCSLAGVVVSRIDRDPVTQLGDERACARHEALRTRLELPTASVLVAFDEQSTVAYGKLYGGTAWDAALSRVAADLDRTAHGHGGQAYHVSKLGFHLLVDSGDLDAAVVAAEGELGEYDGLVWRVDVP